MGIGTMMCLSLGIIFLIMAIVFTILQEKAAVLVSGFNSYSKEERLKFDTKRLSRDHRNMFLIWALIMGIGTLVCMFIDEQCVYIAMLVWLVFFFKEVKLDQEKAFGKYRR